MNKKSKQITVVVTKHSEIEKRLFDLKNQREKLLQSNFNIEEFVEKVKEQYADLIKKNNW